ncbi:MAG TPA: protein kinase [Candidatus Saccharimonadales bacterium]|nr:protein kinase [Candidatus Saccharimonadales bacterium]
MLTPERWNRIKPIFHQAVDLSQAERGPFLAHLCAEEPSLQADLEELLQQHDEMDRFLDPQESLSSQPEGSEAGLSLREGDVVAARYRTIRFLGAGGMGEVYEVEDAELGGRLALKAIRADVDFSPWVQERFRREVQLCRRITHPAICRIFDIGYHQTAERQIPFLTMELVEGETLAERLRSQGRLQPDETLSIARQLCEGLDAAHRAGILHRDFKSGNVMLMQAHGQTRAVITDFGLARELGKVGPATAASTASGMLIGTPHSMAPEQIEGAELTPATDIYALGLVLYEMVTGRRPFEDKSAQIEMLKRLSEAPPAPSTFAPGLDLQWDTAILRCLERRPEARFISALEVTEFLELPATSVIPTGTGPVSKPAISFHRQTILAIAGILLLLFIGTLRGPWLHNLVWPRPLPAEKHIAVVPFTVKGTNETEQATAYALAESLSVNLNRLQGANGPFWVVPWSEEVLKQLRENVGHAASTLGANVLVTGELRRTKDRVWLHAQIEDASTLKILRSQTIEIPEAQIVTIEDRLLEQVSLMLQLQLPPGGLHRLPVDETSDPGAYEFYQQGRGYLLRYDTDNVDRAIVLFQKAIEKDANFAMAYANLAFAYAWKFHDTKNATWIAKARPVCDRAIELNDNLASAHLAMGLIQQAGGDRDAAILELDRAVKLDPADDEAKHELSMAYENAGRLLRAEIILKDALSRRRSWINYTNLGYFYYRNASYQEAEPLFRAAKDLAPDSALALSNLGAVYLALGRYKEAESVLQRLQTIQPTADIDSNLGTAYLYQGRYAEATTMFEKAREMRPDDDRIWCNLGDAYALAGNRGKAAWAYQQAVARVMARAPMNAEPGLLALYYAKLGLRREALHELAKAVRSSANSPNLLFNSVLVYEMAGDRQRALDALRSALRAGFSPSSIQSAPELTGLRQDKAYVKIVGDRILASAPHR